MATDSLHPSRRRRWVGWAVAGGGLTTAWLATAALEVALVSPSHGPAVLATTSVGLVLSVLCFIGWERSRWWMPARRLARQVDALAVDPGGGVEFLTTPELGALADALNDLSVAFQQRLQDTITPLTNASDSNISSLGLPMTRSGLYESPSGSFDDLPDSLHSGEFTTTDMVDRLDPKIYRWLESSPAEQQFLGWSIAELREKSFLEIVHPDDLARVTEGFRTALAKGEAHGLLFRIRTAAGKHRAIVMNVGARYGPALSVSHLRCHLTDVTAKVRSERERKLRNRELTQVNEQLRLINRELEELKERYRDLYENAPAMYFSLDKRGLILECNDTLLRTLGYRRDALLGRSYESILPPDRRVLFPDVLADFLRKGTTEYESRWVKADGEMIDVWIKGTSVCDSDGRFTHSRSVAQDVTARHRLESELKEKHEHLAAANEELSRRNTEMDEFTHVVSHDLQEPLRTLDAFSEYLLRDYGDHLDEQGREYVNYIAEASHRMRALIHDLLTLSRAGRVTGDLAPVSLDDLIPVIRADLAELIRSKNGHLRAHSPLPVIWGDRRRIGQLLTNLVSNGLKYNDKPEPLVEVGQRAKDQAGTEVTFFVRDNGIGIESRHHAKIFQLFRRLHSREEYGGTGAGLAICEKIVRAHGGRIWLESIPGEGTTFFVTLSDAALAPGVEPTAPA